MKYITLGEYATKKLVNLAYFGNSRIVKVIKVNKDNTILCRLYDGTGVTDRNLKSDDMIEVR